ncbi:MAG: hypothetical protein GY938_00630 [Ketobacter sp.]|nr:hypothetical protein [Ketobacter sp.]
MAIGTTNYNLAGFIDEVLEILRGLDGLNYIPDNPSLNPGIWPYVTVYSSEGTSVGRPAGLVQTDLNSVTIALVVPLDDLAKATAFLLPYREQIPMSLLKWFYDKGQPSSRHAQHIGTSISVVMGPIEWPQGQQMFGYLITLNDVKIQNEVV